MRMEPCVYHGSRCEIRLFLDQVILMLARQIECVFEGNLARFVSSGSLVLDDQGLVDSDEMRPSQGRTHRKIPFCETAKACIKATTGEKCAASRRQGAAPQRTPSPVPPRRHENDPLFVTREEYTSDGRAIEFAQTINL